MAPRPLSAWSRGARRGYMAAFMNEVGQSFVALIDHPRLRVERLRASATLARVDGSTINCHWGLSARGGPGTERKNPRLGTEPCP